jgi:hypothetical protein
VERQLQEGEKKKGTKEGRKERERKRTINVNYSGKYTI